MVTPPRGRAGAGLAAAALLVCVGARAAGAASAVRAEPSASASPTATPSAVAPAPAPATITLHVPRVHGPVVVNAELEGKAMWEADAGNTHDFTDAGGQGMVPYSEAKLRWGNGMLYLMLYAGDLDLEGAVTRRDGPVEDDDAFHVEFGVGDRVRVVSVSVLGTLADASCGKAKTRAGGRSCDRRWQSHARVAVDRDGTLNRVGDNDEEWVVEMAIPLADLGVSRATPGTRIAFSIQRCEVGRRGRQSCGGWGASPRGELVLDR